MTADERTSATPGAISRAAASHARLFDRLGMDYQHAFDGRKQAQIDAVDQLAARLSPGARVLDVGCGTGIPTTAQLCAKGLAVTGVDVSEVMLEHARRQVPQARFLKADLFTAAPDLGSYDAVVSFFCLINLPERTFTKALRRLRSLTVPGGTVLVAVPERHGDEEARFVDFSYQPIRCRSEDVARWARRAGLDVDRTELRPDPGPRGQTHPGRSIFLWARAPLTNHRPAYSPAETSPDS